MVGDAEIRVLTAELYVRRDTGVLVPIKSVQIGDWKPQPNLCHDNAETWMNRTGDQVVKGFLYFDFDDALDYVQFNPHSVIRRADGSLWDITPQLATQRYPFIEHQGTAELFEEAERRVNILHHK